MLPKEIIRSEWASLQGVASAVIRPLNGPVTGSLLIPGSKSVTNRALIMAAAGQGQSVVRGALRSDDSFWCLDALRRLGVDVAEEGDALRITRAGEWLGSEIFIGSGGTTGRFLTSVLALSATMPITITASDQLSARPMQPLFEALTVLGARFHYKRAAGHFPVEILPPVARAREISMSGAVSSQFISGVLMAAPLLDHPVTLRIGDAIVQADYVRITLAMLRDFGIVVEANPAFDRFTIQPGAYQPADYTVEADASTASYFLALAAVTGGRVTLENLPEATFQPDIKFIDVLQRMGCLVERAGGATTLHGPAKLQGGFSVDMNACSDTALTLAAIAPFAAGAIEITGVEHIRKHECDRVAVMSQALRAVGVPVEDRPDGWRIEPAVPAFAQLETHDDHRIAMSLAVLGVAGSGVDLLDPGCVSKTCPEFFDMLTRLGVEMEFKT